MKSLDGLWKDTKGRVLVQLHVTKTCIRREVEELATGQITKFASHISSQKVECTLRVIRGNWRARDAVSPLVLISILPKHDVTITIIDVSFHHEHHDAYYSIEGVVVRKDRDEYGPGPITAALRLIQNKNAWLRSY